MDWTLQNDKQSVHVGINNRIRDCRINRISPKRILLGRVHSKLYMQEKGWRFIPKGQHEYNNIPMEFNVRGLYGIAVATAEKTP